ncbi:hypothetical protein QNI16_35730 [Cytophagaceae bacterium YF14B1]|uniref:Uncharacterized protein n=1 Tax=Xanthocytophaga flava TaxID=3048013 RepID=A0AAE3QUY1_9BACT|nr:hypothetical protein [Xanthocytophaga flavus]MDJ1485887.1 hypothetical protein [Xanthocytophaga flavus]
MLANKVYLSKDPSSCHVTFFACPKKVTKEKALFSDPSARKAKGQPRGEKIPYAPTPPSMITVSTTLFVTTLLLLF